MSNLTAVTGLPGRGKTATAVYMSYKLYHRKGRKVISNTPLRFKHQFLEPPKMPKDGSLPQEWEDLVADPENKAQKAMLLLDEIHGWMDARESMSGKNVVLTEFFTQLRKRGLDSIYTTQDWAMVDRRLRKLTTHLIHCSQLRGGVMRGLLFVEPWYRPDQTPEDVALRVKGVYSLYDTFYRVKRPRKVT